MCTSWFNYLIKNTNSYLIYFRLNEIFSKAKDNDDVKKILVSNLCNIYIYINVFINLRILLLR